MKTIVTIYTNASFDHIEVDSGTDVQITDGGALIISTSKTIIKAYAPHADRYQISSNPSTGKAVIE